MTTPHKHAEVLIAIAEGREVQFLNIGWETPSDIAFANPLTFPKCEWRVKPVAKTGWMNVYPSIDSVVIACITNVYKSKESADQSADSDRIACIPVTFTEGEGL